MNDAPDDTVEPTPKTPRGHRMRGWAAGHPRLRFAILGVVALAVIAGTWTGISLNGTSAASPAASTSTPSSEAPGSQTPSSEPSPTKSDKDEKSEPTKKPDKPEPKPESDPTSEEEKPATAAGCEDFSGNPQIACNLLDDHGFDTGQMDCLNSLWDHESGWNHKASNPSSGAYGIPQALPGDKMATAGSDWSSNPATQIEWGLGYIGDRYGDPCGAWSFWQANNYY